MKNQKGFVYVTVMLCILLVVMLISSIIYCVDTYNAQKEGIPTQTSEFYVNDFANVFTTEQKEDLVKKAKDFAESQSDGIQVVITTVKSLNRNSNRRLCS